MIKDSIKKIKKFNEFNHEIFDKTNNTEKTQSIIGLDLISNKSANKIDLTKYGKDIK